MVGKTEQQSGRKYLNLFSYLVFKLFFFSQIFTIYL